MWNARALVRAFFVLFICFAICLIIGNVHSGNRQRTYGPHV